MSDNKNNLGQVLSESVSWLATKLLERKPKAEREPSRVNLWIVGIAALLLFTGLDLISALLVGGLTNALYGVLTFSVGVGTLVVAMVGHFYAYASRGQKIISVIDIVVSIGSTLTIGLLAALINAGKFFDVFTASQSGNITGIFEIIMLVGLVLAGVLHAILFLAYIFWDDTIKRYQRNATSRADQNETMQTITMARQNTAAVIAMAMDLQDMIDAGQGDVLRANLKLLTGGHDILGDLVSNPAVPQSQPRPLHQPMHPNGDGANPTEG